MRERPIKDIGYEGNSVAVAVLEIDEGMRRRIAGYPGGSACGNGIRPMAGLSDPDPGPAGPPIDREDPFVRERSGDRE